MYKLLLSNWIQQNPEAFLFLFLSGICQFGQIETTSFHLGAKCWRQVGVLSERGRQAPRICSSTTKELSFVSLSVECKRTFGFFAFIHSLH